MTELDPLTEQQVDLFLRIDAAMPSDPMLCAAAGLWQAKREGKVMPMSSEMEHLPDFVRRHVFEADLVVGDSQRWIVSGAGNLARLALDIGGEGPSGISNKGMAVRLGHLFDLVSQKAEPYSVMLEMPDAIGARQLVEVYAAPLSPGEMNRPRIFAVLNSRAEAQN